MLLDNNLDRSNDRFLKTRNWLNVIFIIFAVAGMAVYYFSNQTVGSIVIIVGMVFKFVECILRFLR